jgi:SNF2 family DNA or RNA helicase
VSALSKRFGGLKIQGGQKPAEVEEAKQKFQNLPVEEAPVIVVSITAGGLGHTLTAAQDMLFVEQPWTPAEVDQTIARCHRIGQKGSVTAITMLAEGTIDDDIWRLLELKRHVIDAATEGKVVAAQEVVGDLLVNLALEGLGDSQE